MQDERFFVSTGTTVKCLVSVNLRVVCWGPALTMTGTVPAPFSRAMSRDESIYPDPETFNPDKFLKGGGANGP